METLIGYMRMSPNHNGNDYHFEMLPLGGYVYYVIDMNGREFPNKDLNRKIALSVENNTVPAEGKFYTKLEGQGDE
jgi:hypothetical protein